MLVPAVTLTIATFAFNLLGDGLRDALDPHMRGHSVAPGGEHQRCIMGESLLWMTRSAMGAWPPGAGW